MKNIEPTERADRHEFGRHSGQINHTKGIVFKLEDIGAGDGLPTECEHCGKPGTPRQQFEHMGVEFPTSAPLSVLRLQVEGEWS